MKKLMLAALTVAALAAALTACSMLDNGKSGKTTTATEAPAVTEAPAAATEAPAVTGTPEPTGTAQ